MSLFRRLVRTVSLLSTNESNLLFSFISRLINSSKMVKNTELQYSIFEYKKHQIRASFISYIRYKLLTLLVLREISKTVDFP